MTDKNPVLLTFEQEMKVDIEADVQVEATPDSGSYGSSDSATLTLSFEDVETVTNVQVRDSDIEEATEEEVAALVTSLTRHHAEACTSLDGVVEVEAPLTPERVIGWLKADPVRMADVLARMVVK